MRVLSTLRSRVRESTCAGCFKNCWASLFSTTPESDFSCSPSKQACQAFVALQVIGRHFCRQHQRRPGRAGLDLAGPGWAELSWARPDQTGPGQTGPSRARPGLVGPGQTELKLGLAQWFIPVLMTYQWFSSGFPVVFSSGLFACLWCLANVRFLF